MKRSKLIECIRVLEKRTKEPETVLKSVSTPKLFEYKTWLLKLRVLLKEVGR